MSTETLCRLCRKETALRESHIIPKFAFRWIKETSATGNLRFSQTPNKRVQDGEKPKLLCHRCEEFFSGFETEFSSKVFYPYHKDNTIHLNYSIYLIKFSTSLSWRVLTFFSERGLLNNFSQQEREIASRVCEHWRLFLLGDVPNLSDFEQHLLPVSYISKVEGGDIALGMNYYLMRTTDMDCLHSSAGGLVMTKLPGFIFLGFMSKPSRKYWQGTKINLKGGKIEPREYKIPRGFGRYLNSKAENLHKAISKLSPQQRGKIVKAYSRQSPDVLANSKTFEAISHDIELSGNSMFIREADDD
jgi:hypothetical protein